MQQIDTLSNRGKKISASSIERMHNPSKYKPCKEELADQNREFNDWYHTQKLIDSQNKVNLKKFKENDAMDTVLIRF